MTAEELKEALASGNILYISDPQTANGIPHYHVFVKKIDGGYLTTACCTSQFEKNLKYTLHSVAKVSTRSFVLTMRHRIIDCMITPM